MLKYDKECRFSYIPELVNKMSKIYKYMKFKAKNRIRK